MERLVAPLARAYVMRMSDPRGFPSWEELYRHGTVEALPWYWPTLDPDLEGALAKFGVDRGRLLDEGTGPGTQAIALAERGFEVTAVDVSAAAIAYGAREAARRGVPVTFVADDVLATRLRGPYDVIFDRGCFHVLQPEARAGYVRTMRGLLAPQGWLFLKAFSHLQPGEQGPYRFTPEQIRALFEGDFEVVELHETVYQGQLEPWPQALFCALRRRDRGAAATVHSGKK